MDVIQEVGSYAGFAAVVGLAVLSALYFSQARDVRRLREWAGRAPERTVGQAVPQPATPEQGAQQATRPAPTGAVRPIPAARPADAKPGDAKPTESKPAEGPKESPAAAPPVPATAAAGATPAAAKGPAPATPAAAPAKSGAVAPAGRPPPVAAPGAGTPPPAVSGKPPAVPARPPAIPGRPPAVPARPGPVARSPAAATSQSTAVLPPSARPRTPLRDEGNVLTRLGGRYIALIVAGVIVLGGAAAFGISQIGGDEEPASESSAGGGDEPQAPVNPSTVTVSVLNGTTVPGLAAQIGDEVESAGFQRGNVANALDQQRTSSVVLYAEGADREARIVARRLGIRELEPVDPDSQALAGNASVVVIVGADQTQ